MLNLYQPLRFPTLKYIGKVRISPVKNPKPLFRLEWRNDWFVTIPHKYETILNRYFRFALGRKELQAVRENSRKAIIEWCQDGAHDTMIREILMEPAVAHVYVAFRVLADNLVTIRQGELPEDQWPTEPIRISDDGDWPQVEYFRGPGYHIKTHLMLFKFWCGQTGHGAVKAHARFDELCGKMHEYLSDPTHPYSSEEAGKKISDFVTTAHKFMHTMNEDHDVGNGNQAIYSAPSATGEMHGQ